MAGRSTFAFTSAPLFEANVGGFWREADWRNWRRRIYRPAAQAAGIERARPYDLRHAFASLLIYEGRLSVVDIARQLGHNPTVCLDTYAHVMAEQCGAERCGAAEMVMLARSHAPRADEIPGPVLQMSLDNLEV